MKEYELIERYIYAVTKNLSKKSRADVAQELRSIISDMLDERCGDAAPTEEAVIAVLTELGLPSALAEKYDPDSGKCLIGGAYYKLYKLVLKTVLICVSCGVAIAGAVSVIMAKSVWYVAFAQWLGTVFNAMVFAFAFVTLMFAFFNHENIRLNIKAGKIENLPPIPKETAKISRSEPIAGMIATAIFAVIFIAAPQIICLVLANDGIVTPVFNVDVVRNTWYFVAALAGLSIIGACARLIDGRYTRRVMVVTVVTNLLSVAVSFWWLLSYKLLNPKLIEVLSKVLNWNSPFLARIISNLQHYFLGIIIFFLMLDIVMTFVKTLKADEI